MLESFVKFFLEAVDGMGYTGIVILMALESSLIPFPSEVIVPPAGYLAAQGKMNIYLVILSGTAGTLLGALVNYYIAAYMGRGLLKKYSKYFLLDDEKLDKVDVFFAKHGEITTFTGRLIPVIRQYIPFPAGLARMGLPKFCFFTGLGAGIWIMVLAWVGYVVGNNPELIHGRLVLYSLIMLVFVALLIGCYIYFHKKRACNRR